MAALEPTPAVRPNSIEALFLRLCTAPDCVICYRRSPGREVREVQPCS